MSHARTPIPRNVSWQCYYGSDPDLTANDEEAPGVECNMLCAGISTEEVCGGYNRINVYTYVPFGIADGLTYVGCYEDVKANRTMNAVGASVSSSMTNEVRVVLHTCFFVSSPNR